MDFYKELDKCRAVIDKGLEEITDIDLIHQKEILDSMRYSLFTGGKRIRPVLSLKSYELFSDRGTYEEIIPYAAAIEMIHTYSLIHDDLPAMDDDDYRRGKLTNHKKFGEAMAILAGDGLLNLAFEIMMDDIITREDREKYLRSSRLIGRNAGIEGMVGGQVMDLYGDKSKIGEEELIYMYKTKTGGLINSSIMSGAIIGGASEKELEIMEEFSINLGLAYQLQDDVLDKKEDEEIDKLTYFSVLGDERGLKDLDYYSDEALRLLKKLGNKDTSFFESMISKLRTREV